DERIKQCTAPWRIRRWQVIRCALVNPKPAAEIALEVGLARQTVHNLGRVAQGDRTPRLSRNGT
ncbi:MAG TPA: hypothetical protein VE844_05480, partial [Gammaproteobacteria bacterium]|nr:hypothetical protein [Gammaproteobacteria bacterium]